MNDLALQSTFPELPERFHHSSPTARSCHSVSRDATITYFVSRLVAANSDADTYFACLAASHKARLKYEMILSTQPIPTLEQVGPRRLLQSGKLSGDAGLLFWRKWFFDIDNRAGQETGYLFEPIIAYAIGGTPAPAKKSPVKRHGDPAKGRQVDCLLEKKAYELKIRVTIAASGQGRWKEEVRSPLDCRRSGFTPVLVCMDSTSNPKLSALINAFRNRMAKCMWAKRLGNICRRKPATRCPSFSTPTCEFRFKTCCNRLATASPTLKPSGAGIRLTCSLVARCCTSTVVISARPLMAAIVCRMMLTMKSRVRKSRPSTSVASICRKAVCVLQFTASRTNDTRGVAVPFGPLYSRCSFKNDSRSRDL